MSRAQLALNVDDVDEAITFYSKLFNTGPAKVKPGYANFSITEPPLKLVLIENRGHGGTLNHLGVEVESSDAVHTEIARLTNEGLFTDEELGTTCCFATQDKVWVTGPAGITAPAVGSPVGLGEPAVASVGEAAIMVAGRAAADPPPGAVAHAVTMQAAAAAAIMARSRARKVRPISLRRHYDGWRFHRSPADAAPPSTWKAPPLA